MIRIKAPRAWLNAVELRGITETRAHKQEGDETYRLYTEAMHRRVPALVRACEETERAYMAGIQMGDALAALRAQSEREARRAEKEAKK